MTHVYRIGEVAARTGCSPESIRHYEKLGLLPPPQRGEQGYRHYDQAALERIHCDEVEGQIGCHALPVFAKEKPLAQAHKGEIGSPLTPE